MFAYNLSLHDVSTYSAGSLALAQASLGIFLPILIFCLSGVAVISAYILAPQWFDKLFDAFSQLQGIFKAIQNSKSKKPEEILEDSGFLYDEKQDIFYSAISAWQRKFGYCRLYDEAAALSGIVIDCEPIPFEYQGKKWLIEFWKGQYGMTSGGEVGIFSTEGSALSVPGFFDGIFYQSVGDSELLQMSFSLLKNKNVILTRKDLHWWLTGFKLGEFSEPRELSMEIHITFPNQLMREGFVQGLKNAGYLEYEIETLGNTVSVVYDSPRTKQPFTRVEITDWVIQRKNELLCRKYQELTSEKTNSLDKIKLLQKKSAILFENIISLGTFRQQEGIYEKMKEFI